MKLITKFMACVLRRQMEFSIGHNSLPCLVDSQVVYRVYNKQVNWVS